MANLLQEVLLMEHLHNLLAAAAAGTATVATVMFVGRRVLRHSGVS
jgi:hypothetical protein